jgi:hypothetical protein
VSATHFDPTMDGSRICGTTVRTVDSDGGETTERSEVTCRRCLASLAKRDRELRNKARRWWAPLRGSSFRVRHHGWDIYVRTPEWPVTEWKMMNNAEGAIAAEEGRAPDWGVVAAAWQSKCASAAIARDGSAR